MQILTSLRVILRFLFVSPIYNLIHNNKSDLLLVQLNSYHPNIAFTVEENPNHFQDTAIHSTKSNFTFSVYTKPDKIPTKAGESKVATSWKRNALTGALHCAKRIATCTNFKSKVKIIKKKFQKSCYPRKFIENATTLFKVLKMNF